jgi:hypothetical protein
MQSFTFLRSEAINQQGDEDNFHVDVHLSVYVHDLHVLYCTCLNFF